MGLTPSSLKRKTKTLILWPLQTNTPFLTDKYTNKQANRHGDFMTQIAQRADWVKILLFLVAFFYFKVFCCWFILLSGINLKLYLFSGFMKINLKSRKEQTTEHFKSWQIISPILQHFTTAFYHCTALEDFFLLLYSHNQIVPVYIQ